MIAFVWISSFNLNNHIHTTEVVTDLEMTTQCRQDKRSSLPKSSEAEVASPTFLSGRANIHMSQFISLHVYMAQAPKVNLLKNILSTSENYMEGFSGQTLLLSWQL